MAQATIQALFLKPAKGQALVDGSALGMTMQQGYGIAGDCQGHPLSPRQVLLVRREDLDAFKLHPGDLRENIVLAGLAETEFVPGAVLHLGKSVQIRLSFHCEPCKRIAHVLGTPLKQIVGKRGILGTVVVGGALRCGDCVVAIRLLLARRRCRFRLYRITDFCTLFLRFPMVRL
ncbi:MOSC domain-containing protein [Herpetosiphon llansteffanensis]|uniref:MOSC domain-containing protein n=1 Tax=Herpetosiphon llansteffanensis TaxID=2094568 RepID=UPI0013E0B7EF|nr:MOSC domain-containing protein [Herpetosiphon llansteffanensis]